MTSTVFRQKIEEPKPADNAEKKPVSTDSTSIVNDVEVPFTDYETTHHKPFTVDYFNLSELWDDPDGGFTDEIKSIEEYLINKVKRGDISNTLSSIKGELKTMEKMNDLNKEDRPSIKLGVLSSYAKFLMEVDGVKYNARKYANA